MATTWARYLVSGYEVRKQGNDWQFQDPFCDFRPFDVEFGDNASILTTLDVGSGYRVRISAGISNRAPELLYWLDKDGSPYSDTLLGVTKGDLVGSALPANATGAPFPYWFFYANIQTDLKVWVRFLEGTAQGPRADLIARDTEEHQSVQARSRR